MSKPTEIQHKIDDTHEKLPSSSPNHSSNSEKTLGDDHHAVSTAAAAEKTMITDGVDQVGESSRRQGIHDDEPVVDASSDEWRKIEASEALSSLKMSFDERIADIDYDLENPPVLEENTAEDQDAIINNLIDSITEKAGEDEVQKIPAVETDAVPNAPAVQAAQKRKASSKEKGKGAAVLRRSTRTRRNPNIVIQNAPAQEDAAPRKRMKRASNDETVQERNARIGRVVKESGVLKEYGPREKFFDHFGPEMYADLSKRNMIDEVNIFDPKFTEAEVDDILQLNDLVIATSQVKPYVRNVVLEFYSNLRSSIYDPDDNDFEKVLVREHWYSFSPDAISAFLGHSGDDEDDDVPDFNEVASILTNGLVTIWPEGGIPSSQLTKQVAALNAIFRRNIMPSTHAGHVSQKLGKVLADVLAVKRFHLGQIIFDEIMEFIEDPRNRRIPYPSLIYNLLCSQKELIEEGEHLGAMPTEMAWSNKWTTGAHGDSYEPEIPAQEEDNIEVQIPDLPPAEIPESVFPAANAPPNAHFIGKTRKRQLIGLFEAEIRNIDSMMTNMRQRRSVYTRNLAELRALPDD